MTVNSGEVKSAAWSDEKLNVEFKIPESDRTKTVKLEKHQVKNLISHLSVSLPIDLVGKQVPLFKDVAGRYFIDAPESFKRGNKVKYKLRRFGINYGLYEWSDVHKKRSRYYRPLYEDVPKNTYHGMNAYYPTNKFKYGLFASSLLNVILSLLVITSGYAYTGPFVLLAVTINLLFSAFICLLFLPDMFTKTYRIIFPDGT